MKTIVIAGQTFKLKPISKCIGGGIDRTPKKPVGKFTAAEKRGLAATLPKTISQGVS